MRAARDADDDRAMVSIRSAGCRIALAAAVAIPVVMSAAPASAVAAAGAGADRPVIVYQGVDPQQPGNNSIFVADARGDHRREILTAVPGDLTHPDWSPDGRSIAFVIDGRSIDVASATGGDPHPLVGCTVRCSGVDFPAWSPDGRSIAYTRYVEPGPAGPPLSSVIVVRDLRSGSEREVAHSDPGQVLDVPRWSGDGRRLAVGIDRFDQGGAETGSAIAVVDARTGAFRRLTDFARYAYAPDWRPGGDELVFSLETLQYAADPPAGPRDLFLIRADGSGLRRLTHVRGDRMVWQPAFAADGRSLVATLDEPGARRGVRVDLAGGDLERLASPSIVMTHLKERR